MVEEEREDEADEEESQEDDENSSDEKAANKEKAKDAAWGPQDEWENYPAVPLLYPLHIGKYTPIVNIKDVSMSATVNAVDQRPEKLV